jgi:fused signal recognition particle receptor
MKFRSWGSSLKSLLNKSDITAQEWSEIEDQLLMADVGVTWTKEIISNLKKTASNKLDLVTALSEQLLLALQTKSPRELNLSDTPAVLVMVGVNGVGKTTSMGKLGNMLTKSGKSVVFGAADTFRAAAVNQITSWGEKSSIPVISKPEGSDPASVAHEAISFARANDIDVVLLDTAGRLHNKKALMDELGKVIKVSQKIASVTEILLVIDATLGQNSLVQAKVFSESIPVTGIILTKFDGTAKGGMAISIQQELGIPVKFIGVGEGLADLMPFDPQWFVAQLLET